MSASQTHAVISRNASPSCRSYNTTKLPRHFSHRRRVAVDARTEWQSLLLVALCPLVARIPPPRSFHTRRSSPVFRSPFQFRAQLPRAPEDVVFRASSSGDRHFQKHHALRRLQSVVGVPRLHLAGVAGVDGRAPRRHAAVGHQLPNHHEGHYRGAHRGERALYVRDAARLGAFRARLVELSVLDPQRGVHKALRDLPHGGKHREHSQNFR
mmetsp:Transcript_6666/g.16357  ORF Transcript_6666/g.16357 Transcript_6666/m.16357 type:complete len:211 (-) Transcript_6666:575-1207(-)